MTDKETLDKVYRRLCDVSDNWHNMNMDRMFDRWHDLKDLIEQERQSKEPNESVERYKATQQFFNDTDG